MEQQLLVKQKKLLDAAKKNNVLLFVHNGFQYSSTDVDTRDEENNSSLYYVAE